MTALAQRTNGIHTGLNHAAMTDRLLKIVAAIAPNEQKISARVVRSTNPQKVGKIISSPAFYELYLVNESDRDITSIILRASSLGGESEEQTELKRFTSKFKELRRGRALLLEQLDMEGLEVVMHYDLELKFTDGFRIKAAFLVSRDSFISSVDRYFSALKADAHAFTLMQPDRTN